MFSRPFPLLNCPSLNTVQYLRALFEVRGQNWTLYSRCGLIRVQGQNLSPSSAGPSVLDTVFLMPLAFLAIHLAHIHLAINQHPQVPFWGAVLKPLFMQPSALQGVVVTKVQDLAFCLIGPHAIFLSPCTVC